MAASRGTYQPIPLARPVMKEGDIRAAERALRSGWLVMGPENQRFESRLCEITGRAHAVTVSSGSTALELALWALARTDSSLWRALTDNDGSDGPGGMPAGKRPRPDVVIPAAGFPAAFNAAVRLGLRVVAVDIDPYTWTMDADAVRQAVSDATCAVVSVDAFGVVAETRPLLDIADDTGVAIIDDAACSLGGFDSSGRAGAGYGDLATLSFHPRKLITTGEGGAVLCDEPELAECVRALRNQGQPVRGRFAYSGTNARLSDIAAAVGVSQLDRLSDLVSERRLLVAGYRERLAGLRDAGLLSWQDSPEGAHPAHQTFAVLLGENLPGGRSREHVMDHMRQRAIETGVASFSLNRLEMCTQAAPWIAEQRFVVSESLHDRGLALPLYSGMRSAELDRVAETLSEAIR